MRSKGLTKNRFQGGKPPFFYGIKCCRGISGEREEPELTGALLPDEGVYRNLWSGRRGLRFFGA